MVKGNHFGELTAAAGALAAVGILVLIMTLMVDVRFAGATFPGQPGKIAYFSPVGSPGTDADIYTINPNGNGQFPVTKNNTGGYDPSFSPNGKRIAYAGWDGHDWEIYIIDARDRARVQLTQNGTDDFSPRGGTVRSWLLRIVT